MTAEEHLEQALRLFPPGTRVVALPDWTSPRLLLAADPWNARFRRGALYPSFRLGARLHRFAVRLAGLGAPARQVPADAGLPATWGDETGGGATVAVLPGTPGPARKAVARLEDGAGHTVAYVKIGWTEVGCRRIGHEYRVLRQLPAGFGPRALSRGDVRGGKALLLSAIPGLPLSGRVRPWPEMHQVQRRLLAASRRADGEHPWCSSLAARRPEARPLLDRLAAEDRIVSRHGDFAPWNVVGRGPAAAAVDWEYGSLEGFPGADLAAGMLQCAFLLRGWSPRRAADTAGQWLVRNGWCVSLQVAEALVRLAALDALLLSEEDGLPAHSTLQVWRHAVWSGV